MRHIVKLLVAAVAVFLFAGPTLAQERLWGTIRGVDQEQKQIIVNDVQGTDHTIKLAEDADVTFQGQEGDLGMLKVGDDVSVMVEREGEQLQASEVQIEKRYIGGEPVRPQE